MIYMKKMKKSVNLILVIVIMIIVSTLFINTNVYAAGSDTTSNPSTTTSTPTTSTESGKSIYESTFEKGKKFGETAETGKIAGTLGLDNILDEAGGLIDTIFDTNSALYIIGIAFILVGGTILFIKLSMGGSAATKADAKTRLTIFVVVFLIFILASQIIGWVVELLENVEGTM